MTRSANTLILSPTHLSPAFTPTAIKLVAWPSFVPNLLALSYPSSAALAIPSWHAMLHSTSLASTLNPLSQRKRYNASSFHTPRLTLSLVTSIFSMVLTGAVSPLALCPCHAVVFLYCATFDLVHIKPTGFCPRNDHVYARAQLSVVYSAEPAVIASDHHCLLVKIAPSHTTDAAPAFGLKRYYLCCLDNPRVSALLCGVFGVIAPLLIDTLSTATHSIASLSAPGRQCLVDKLDAQVLSAVSECCSTALGTYQVSKVRISPDQYISRLQACTRPSDAVTLFKRSCKTVVSTALASRDPSIKATEDAAFYFESVFTQPDSSLRESLQLFNNVTAHPAQRLLSFLVLTMYASTLSAIP
ncbi:hypothetical protein DSO57_1030382 [Entomophthora muscae]|uniref:Uncharacterized protein n=1 Tax=Entomophthora muscae TaxID=34485 RepID=A0ACC2ULS4_9FUNG|nr:hypothetical protein DSO57_1030382 [Entomophthora muscae]